MEQQLLLRPKIKRTSLPKARTGCITCKARRVKCGEEKPECTRCLCYNGKCGGYVREAPLKRLPSGFKVLMPSLQPICRTPAAKLFTNNLEYSYFQRFCTFSVGQLTGLRNSELWTRVVLQATETDEAIRHAATAIGTLDFKHRPGIYDDPDGSHKEFAYSEYQKAIMGLRKSLTSKDCDIRTKLISCILFSCFEAYHGNNDHVVTQVFFGVEMMAEYQKLRNEPPKGLVQAPLPAIDVDLEQEFELLEIQSSALADQRSPDLHFRRMKACAEVVETMPSEFKSIKEASYFLSKNMLRGIHLRFSQVNAHDQAAINNIPPFISLKNVSEGPAFFELGHVLAAFSRWKDAFAPLYKKSKAPSGSHWTKGATLLRMHHLGSLLWVAGGSPGASRSYTKELKELLLVCKSLLNMLDLEAGSSSPLDMVVVLPLAVIGWIYRHRAIRQEVIQIFASLDRKESIWDSRILGVTIAWMAEIEEEGLGDEEEYVPDDVVAHISKLETDAARRTVSVSCLQGVRGYPGKTVTKEAILVW